MNVNQMVETAIKLQNEGKLNEAEHIYKEILQFMPNNASVNYNLGIIFHDKGELDDAAAYFMKALQFNPTLVDALYNLGIVLKDKGEIDVAKICYQKAIQIDPKFASAYFGLAKVSQTEGQRFSPKVSSFSAKWTPGTSIYQVDNEKKLLYIEIPKAGSTTIKYEYFWKSLFGNNVPLEIASKLNTILGFHYTNTLEPYKDYFKFTVLRDPYTRFMSAYYHLINKRYRDKINIHVVKLLGIEDWLDEIVNDPNQFIQNVDKEILNRDRHTALQKKLLPEDLNEINYIGKIENMEEVGKILSQILNYKIEFVSQHCKGREIDYYSIKIDIDRFNQLFMEDYEMLGQFYEPLNRSSFSNC